MVELLAILSGISGEKNDNCAVPARGYLEVGGDVWGKSIDSGGDEFAVTDAGSQSELSTIQSALGVDEMDARSD